MLISTERRRFALAGGRLFGSCGVIESSRCESCLLFQLVNLLLLIKNLDSKSHFAS